MSGETAGTANGPGRDDLPQIAGLGQDMAHRLDEACQAAAGSGGADAWPSGLLEPIVRLRPDCTLLRAAQPFGVTLSLDLTKVAPRANGSSTTTITIDAGGLPPGIYLLEAAVRLRVAGASQGGVAAMAEGIMLQVLPA